MSVYVVIESRVKDPEKYNQYVSHVPGIVAKHGGRYLVRGGKVAALMESRWTPERMIVLEFPSEDSVKDWLASAEYRAIAPLREEGAEIRAVLLEGYEEKRDRAL